MFSHKACSSRPPMNQSPLDLPTELLFNICQHLEPTDLLNVAKLCHQLNYIAIEVYMRRTASPYPGRSCIIRPGLRGHMDELTALIINFPLVTMNELFCIFNTKQEWSAPEDHKHSSQMVESTWNIYRVTQLINRLSSIRSLSLIITAWGSRWSLRSTTVQEFLFAVIRLIETTVSKGCTSLQILRFLPSTKEGAYKFELVERPNRPKIGKLWHFFREHLRSTRENDTQLLHGDGWRYRKVCKLNTIRPSILPLHSKLTKLDISCDVLLIPPFSTWTLGIMKCSPIISLRLSLPNIITKEEFRHYLFPRILSSLPNLRSIEFVTLREGFLPIVIDGIHLLPYLQAITFGLSYYPILPPTSVLFASDLPHLTSFTGSSDQAAYIFGRLGFSCPNLQFVNIIVDVHFRRRLDYGAIAQNFHTFNARFSEMGIQPCVSVCIANHGEPADVALMSTIGHHEHFFTVSRLTLELPSSLNDLEVPGTQYLIRYVLDWLRTFQGLKGLTLLHRHTSLDPSAPEVCPKSISDAITRRYPDIVLFNIVNLPSKPMKYHYHWSNAHDDWERGTDGIVTMPFFEHKSTEPSVCSHF
ncbi:hypothetical protein GALMADRAFT_152006 [Galerina marginata CBS 339.88]|uniref:F-box domain-containing protein n=1 Tax=Galerina marginata (strain CBS 339.88) TaxID=685588 RepID=A0A067TVK1_GALM3|nr:hypothetical protein GALMADRAFT_152006 [Galerina marginata CBS 339.88]